MKGGMMVKLRTDYITRLMPEDIDKLTDDDKIYVEGKYGYYKLNEKMQIQKDDDTISFIYDDRIYVFNFDSVKMYRVREKPNYFYQVSGEITGFENFILGLFCGVMLMNIFLFICGV